MHRLIQIKPVMSEKTHKLSADGVYVFEIPSSGNKMQAIKAVQSQYKVEVLGARVANHKGKAKHGLGRRSRNIKGRTSNIKRAYVQLAKGAKLPIFDAVEDHDHKHDHSHEEVVATKKPAKETK